MWYFQINKRQLFAKLYSSCVGLLFTIHSSYCKAFIKDASLADGTTTHSHTFNNFPLFRTHTENDRNWQAWRASEADTAERSSSIAKSPYQSATNVCVCFIQFCGYSLYESGEWWWWSTFHSTAHFACRLTLILRVHQKSSRQLGVARIKNIIHNTTSDEISGRAALLLPVIAIFSPLSLALYMLLIRCEQPKTYHSAAYTAPPFVEFEMWTFNHHEYRVKHLMALNQRKHSLYILYMDLCWSNGLTREIVRWLIGDDEGLAIRVIYIYMYIHCALYVCVGTSHSHAY